MTLDEMRKVDMPGFFLPVYYLIHDSSLLS